MVLGKNVAVFDWEWGRTSAPRDVQKILCLPLFFDLQRPCIWGQNLAISLSSSSNIYNCVGFNKIYLPIQTNTSYYL